jgi:hypothetical protein
MDRNDFDPPLDHEIAPIVAVLVESGIETFESCGGGEGHAFVEPTVRFHGDEAEGFRAMAVALTRGLPVLELRRAWRIEATGPVGPWWEMTFSAPRTTGSPAATAD